MKDIQPFIDLGFYTVPLDGKLQRLDDGTKTTPKFQSNWRSHYQNNFNENATALGGTITGAISNIIAIDCDDQITYNMFSKLDPDNEFHFISKNKPKGGGTIIYKYPTGAALESFSIQSNLMHLDFYSDNGFVYLPTDVNETKHKWECEDFESLPKLKQIPDEVLLLLNSLQLQYTLTKSGAKEDNSTKTVRSRTNYLAPQVEMFLAQTKFIPSLFRVITPKDFRDLPQYVQHGYLHPEIVPEGRGSEYLSKVSAILGADPSISPDMYVNTLGLINNMWDAPMKASRINSTIIDPMLEGRSSIAGEPIWQYDEHWKERGLAFTTKLGDAVEVFYDDIRASYYMVNYTRDMIKQFYKDSDLFQYIEPIAVALPVRKDLKTMVPVVRTSNIPSLPFGFFSTDDYIREFNLFRQTPGLAILNDPESYKELYNRPETILKFFETFIPDTHMRNYLLKFLKRKLTTFKYSPTVLYFLGLHGSGKDTLVNILASILGDDYIARPSAREFLELFNGWMTDKYFTQLDEYGNQLHTLTDKEEALGRIKAYTGKPSVQIRQMRTDGFKYEHNITFIMTANSNPLMLEDGDRRVAMFDTPNVLKDADWVQAMGGTTPMYDKIQAEINDFCYFLATEIDALSWDDYMSPPNTEMKRDIIAAKLPAAQRLAYYFRHAMFAQLEDLVDESDCSAIFSHCAESRVFEEDLFELYTYMTEGRGTKRGLTKILRDNDFEKVPTTKGGVKHYYYHIPALGQYTPSQPFEDQSTQVEVDGL